MVFIRSSPFINFTTMHYNKKFISVGKLVGDISAKNGLPEELILIYYNGKVAFSEQKIPHDAYVDVCFRMLGGKGGFGSMLRAIGAQIEKTTNREACRDLSGRRLRDINEEQRLKRWLAKKAEREAEQLKRRKAKLERMKAEPKHEFHDPDYHKERSELPERIDDALSQGLKKSSVLNKKQQASKTEIDEPPKKKTRAWLDDEIPSDLSTDDSDVDQPSAPECSRTDTSNSLDPCSSSSSQNSRDAITGQSSSLSQEAFEKPHPCERDKCETSKNNVENMKGTVDEQGTSIAKITEIQIDEVEKIKSKDEQENTNLLQQQITENNDEKSSNNLGNIKENKKDDLDVDLLQFKSTTELENLGLDKLKIILMKLGLKCGGTLSERASRLWSIHGMDPKDYPQALKAKPSKR